MRTIEPFDVAVAAKVIVNIEKDVTASVSDLIRVCRGVDQLRLSKSVVDAYADSWRGQAERVGRLIEQLERRGQS